jgi:hypothetical protein
MKLTRDLTISSSRLGTDFPNNESNGGLLFIEAKTALSKIDA